jgi:pyruvate/2-oxoglutarate dehydrogenase complex dihydrolipoamide acyltransferase (E2) component
VRLVAVRANLGPEIERTAGVKLTYTDLLAALVARVLKQHPRDERQLDWQRDQGRTPR